MDNLLDGTVSIEPYLLAVVGVLAGRRNGTFVSNFVVVVEKAFALKRSKNSNERDVFEIIVWFEE